MKKFGRLLVTLILSAFVYAGHVDAREGSVKLSTSSLACEGVSLWRESSYKVTGRCQGLVYPYETLYDHYVLWATLENGNMVRLDDIDKGYFDGSVSEAYTDLFITAESASNPRRPSENRIVSGSINAFAFDKSVTTTPTASVAPSARPNGAAVQPAPVTTGSTVGSVIGRILRALLIIVAVIIVVAVVASLLFRRRGSVSA